MYQTCAFCRIECRKFDSIRLICWIGFFRFDRPHSRMSNIRHLYSNIKAPFFGFGFSTFDQLSVECRIFDIRRSVLQIYKKNFPRFNFLYVNDMFIKIYLNSEYVRYLRKFEWHSRFIMFSKKPLNQLVNLGWSFYKE